MVTFRYPRLDRFAVALLRRMRATGGGAMSDPIVFMSRHRIKPGQREALRSATTDAWSALRIEKPRTLLNLAYLNDEGTEVTFMHAFADLEAMRLHWQGADERARQAYEYVEPIGFTIYGSVDPRMVQGMRAEAAGGGATVTVWPDFMTGFLRLVPR